MAENVAEKRAVKRRSCATWCLLSTGLLGLAFAVLPWHWVMAACPFLQKSSAWDAWLPWSPPSAAAQSIDEGTGLPIFTAEDLMKFDGKDGSRILLGMHGDVFDVTEKGSVFYGPEASYSLFAARDATRCLALGSLDESDLAKGGDVEDFDEEQKKALKEQHEFYLGKYPRVGKLARVKK